MGGSQEKGDEEHRVSEAFKLVLNEPGNALSFETGGDKECGNEEEELHEVGSVERSKDFKKGVGIGGDRQERPARF